jgi:cysteine-rich repeat protein
MAGGSQGALNAFVSIGVLSCFLHLAAAPPAVAFDGCDVSGTWQSSDGNVWHIGEAAGGVLTGVVSTVVAPLPTPDPIFITAGLRTGGAVVIDALFGGSIGFHLSGHMLSCEQMDLFLQVFSAPAGVRTFTRLSSSYCGDGVMDEGETCDDGNFTQGDACSVACEPAVCGNRILEPGNGEQCDDGNTLPTDGC